MTKHDRHDKLAAKFFRAFLCASASRSRTRSEGGVVEELSIVAEVDETTCPPQRNNALTWRAFAGPASGARDQRPAANRHCPSVTGPFAEAAR